MAPCLLVFVVATTLVKRVMTTRPRRAEDSTRSCAMAARAHPSPRLPVGQAYATSLRACLAARG